MLWGNWCHFMELYVNIATGLLFNDEVLLVMYFQGDCWICMELMDTSLDKFYKFIYERMHERLPENILGKITVAVSIHNSLTSFI